MKRAITLTGDPGAGKTDVGKLLADKLQWKLINIGMIQRNLASEHNMDVRDFNLLMEKNPEFDTLLDNKIKEIGLKNVSIIVDSRIAWHWIPDSLKVFLKVDIDEAARRVLNANRTSERYATIEETSLGLEQRKAGEVKRLKSKYSIDFSDMRNYNLVIDTTNMTPKEVCDRILAKLE